LDALITKIKSQKKKLFKAKRGETTQIDELAIYYSNYLGLPTSPHVKLMFSDKEVTAVATVGQKFA
jgi:hypothetical protein